MIDQLGKFLEMENKMARRTRQRSRKLEVKITLSYEGNGRGKRLIYSR